MKLLLAGLCLFVATLTEGKTVFVKPAGNDAATGLSWPTAVQTLQAALAIAVYGDEIWVATGTYKPTTTSDRTISFDMKLNVSLYGGFSGTETLRAQRNPYRNPTILSGDIGVPGVAGDNSYHVIYDNGLATQPQGDLDGFTITGGNANGAGSPQNKGGGLYSLKSYRLINNCIFTLNNATFGGGIYRDTTLANMTRCTFTGNAAADGAALYNNRTSFYQLQNCVFIGNIATNNGGAICNVLGSAPLITYCSFSGNAAAAGGVIYNSPEGNLGTTLSNCILWNNNNSVFNNSAFFTISSSIVQGGYSGGNIDVNPLFVNQPTIGLGTNGDLHLQPASPAISAAGTSYTTNIDLDGKPRPLGAAREPGAYEYEACPTNGILYVNALATGANNGSSWANAYTDLQLALKSNYCLGITEIWVAKGTYRPTTDANQFASFVMKNNLAIYGGLAGNETSLSQRNISINPTILSADLPPLDNFAGNCYHVVANVDNFLNSSAVLDGFTLTGGYVYGPSPEDQGGGMFNKNASPTIRNCNFLNSTGINGGGMYNDNANPTLVNCLFAGNYTTFGGGIYNSNASPTFTNCVFIGNKGFNVGGAIFNQFSTPVFTNCSFSGNESVNGGGAMFNSSSNPVITNSIVWGNPFPFLNSGSSPVISYSIIEGGGYGGAGNLNVSPQFVSQPPIGIGTAGNLRLQNCSPAINTGLNSANSNGTDIDNNARIAFATIDMGAYENLLIAPPPGGNASINQTISNGGSVVYIAGCANFALLQSTGVRPVTGSVSGKYWVDGILPIFNNRAYVARHFEFTPAVSPLTASGRLTLYFTQSEFNLFNSYSTTDGNLPISLTDMAGKSHLRIYRFGGTSATGAASEYAVGISEINPEDADIIWNAANSRWEVSFNHSGFGGFFVGTSTTASVCPGGTFNWYAPAGATYQWQILVGSTWTNLSLNDPSFSGVNTGNLQSNAAISTSLYNFQIRCLVNEVPAQPVYTIQFATEWLGTTNVWNNPANWSCGIIPDSNTDVWINSNVLIYPQVTSNTAVRSVRVLPNVSVNVHSGVTLQVTGK